MTASANHSTLGGSAQQRPPGAPDALPAAGIAPTRAVRELAEIPIVLRLPDLNAAPEVAFESKTQEDSQITTYLLAAVLVGVLGFLAVDHWKAGHDHYSQMRAAKKSAPPAERAVGGSPHPGPALTNSAPGVQPTAPPLPADPQAPSKTPAVPDPTAQRPAEDRQAASTVGSPVNPPPAGIAQVAGPADRVASKTPLTTSAPAGPPVAKFEGVIEKPTPGPTYDRAQ